MKKANALSRSVIGSLLAVPFTTLVLVNLLAPTFPSPPDPENYYSHSVAWVFICVVVTLSFANNKLWQTDERRRSVLGMRLLLGGCLGSVALDVIGDVVLPAFVLRTRVTNVVAGPLFLAVPLAVVGLVGGFIVARRSASHSAAS